MEAAARWPRPVDGGENVVHNCPHGGRGDEETIRDGHMSLVRRGLHSAFAAVDTFLPRLRGPRILIYHQVGSGRSHEMNVPTEVFARHLDWLAHFGDIVSLEEAVERRGEPEAERLSVLTFDDGYADVYRNAFPLLQRRSIPFTLYLTSGPIESPDDFPHWPGEPLTWDQAKAMHNSGLMTLGAHTHTHPDLRHVDEATATREVEISNELIESRVGATPRHFTYPKGWWSQTADPAVRSGYDTATVGMGPSITATSDLHTLGRVSVMHSDPQFAFRRKMITGGRTEAKARRFRHRYVGP